MIYIYIRIHECMYLRRDDLVLTLIVVRTLRTDVSALLFSEKCTPLQKEVHFSSVKSAPEECTSNKKEVHSFAECTRLH